MKKVLTFGIMMEQYNIVKEAFRDKYDVVDVTECFTDLLAVPADAIVIDPDMVSDDEVEMLNEVFEHDKDTSIVVTKDAELILNHVYVIEDNPDTMECTIQELQERFNLPGDLEEAYKYKNEVLAGIVAAKEVDEELSLRGKVATVYSSCIPYEKVNTILGHIPDMKLKERYPYRSDFNMVLDAFMLSQGLLAPEDRDFDYENGDIDKLWVQSLSESMKRHLRNRELVRRPVYGPIYKKIISWIQYEENKPKTEYRFELEKHDKFRAENDLDCVLNEGNLSADTIFSLWLPLRFALVKTNGYRKMKKITKVKFDYNNDFLERLLVDRNLEKLLPLENETTRLISELFVLGQQKENTMILPNQQRWMQKRGEDPYWDYMPHFLYECFCGGEFSNAFSNDNDLIRWIKESKLEGFFDGNICRDNIIDLAGSGDVKNNLPKDVDALNGMLRKYITILQNR